MRHLLALFPIKLDDCARAAEAARAATTRDLK